MTGDQVVGLAVVVVPLAVLLGLAVWLLGRLSPTGGSTWTNTEELPTKVALTGGPWVITFIRQSHNVHRVDTAATGDEAVSKVQAAFRRAKIGSIRVWGISPDGFTAHRVWHNHRGSSEGKKLGGVSVRRG